MRFRFSRYGFGGVVVLDLGFWVSEFVVTGSEHSRFRGSVSGFMIQGVRFRGFMVPGLGFGVSGYGLRVRGLNCRILGSSFVFWAPEVEFRGLRFRG